MPNLASLEQCRRLLNRLSESASADLDPLFRPGRALQMSGQVADDWVSLVEHYGNLAADIGADQFDQWATELGVSPRVVLADGVNEQRATARLGWALAQPDQLGNARVLLDELVKQPFRSTVQDSALKSGGGWARVPTGADTCGFCLMLASRGGVYRSKDVASLGFSGKKYHGKCDCTPTLVRGPEDYPDGYDPDALYAQYDEARQGVGSDPAKIAGELSRMQSVAAKVIDRAPAPVTWLSESLQGEDLGQYDSQDLTDLYNEAQDAGDLEAVRLTHAELTRREKQMAGYRGTGYTRAELRTQYDEYVERSYWEAESVTNGHMLNEAGKRAKIDPRSLFTGTEARALKYASDDLKYHWTEAPRLSFDAFTGDADAIARAGRVDF